MRRVATWAAAGWTEGDRFNTPLALETVECPVRWMLVERKVEGWKVVLSQLAEECIYSR